MHVSEVRRVMVVEDELTCMRALTRAFERHGFEARGAATAAEALWMLDVFRPELAVVDRVLPDDSGIWLIGELRARRRDLIAVLVSGYLTYHDSVLAGQAGASSALPKPANPHDILLAADGSFPRAAKMLGISTSTLRRRLAGVPVDKWLGRFGSG